MNFSTNQVMQFYCIKPGTTPAVLSDASEGKPASRVKFSFEGVDGKLSSDILSKGNVLSVVSTTAASAVQYRKAAKVKLAGDPIPGEDYTIVLTIRGTVGEECAYTKVASAHAKVGSTAADIQKEIATNLLQNLTEDSELVEVYDSTLTTKYDVKSIESADLAAGFCIVEPVPAWELGTFPESLLNIEIAASEITVNGEGDCGEWLEPTKFDTTLTDGEADFAIPNTHVIADMEYFALGERGAADGLGGFPLRTPYKGLVDSTDTTGYDVLNIHYYHVGALDSVQKSEKELVVVAKSSDASKLTVLKTAAEALM